MAASPDTALRIIGGASFPAPVGTVTFSWPLVAAVVTTEGVDVAIRRSVFRWALVGVLSDSPGPRGVSRFAWDDMAPASLARRTIVLRHRDGYSARFGVLRAGNLAPLVEALHTHAIPVERVHSTWRWELNLK